MAGARGLARIAAESPEPEAGCLSGVEGRRQKARTCSEKPETAPKAASSPDMRVIETGEYKDATAEICFWSIEQCPTCTICAGGTFSVESKINDINWPTNGSNTFEETYIAYDAATLAANTPSANYTQKYLQGRVSKTWNDNTITHYSYDAHGRVTFAVQEITALATNQPTTNFKYKTIDYEYTTKTSRVDKTIFQKGRLQEEFQHKYTYDNDERLTKTEVSRNAGATWLDAAEYGYYNHGPLKNISYGTKIQDIDLTYNINGWLKAINTPMGAGAYANESGEGGTSGTNFGKDLFTEAINYYNGDYKRTGFNFDAGSATVPGAGSNIVTGNKAKDLFNGNISSVVTTTAFSLLTSPPTSKDAMVQAYRYDWLNRLTDVYTEVSDPASFTFSAGNDATEPYKVHLAYDANGNIKDFVRRSMNTAGTAGIAMDEMSYKYAQTTTDYHSITKKTTNKLAHVNDAIGAATVGDIADQGSGYVAGTPSTHNYKYDEKGRIISDLASGISDIDWTVYDKVKKITKSNGDIIEFTYDSKQQRLSKTVDASGGTNDAITTYYVYDASGILMTTYDYRYSSGWKYSLLQYLMYGLNRVGTYHLNEVLVSSPSAPSNAVNKLNLEISDHLGSVRAVVRGDKGANNTLNIVALNDYSDFGWVMSNRNYSSTDYRFGYQGSERDNDILNDKNSYYTTEFRMLDVRLGRWFSPDPITQPWQSPYASMDNNPIALTDLMGLESSGSGTNVSVTGGGDGAYVGEGTSVIGPNGECYACGDIPSSGGSGGDIGDKGGQGNFGSNFIADNANISATVFTLSSGDPDLRQQYSIKKSSSTSTHSGSSGGGVDINLALQQRVQDLMFETYICKGEGPDFNFNSAVMSGMGKGFLNGGKSTLKFIASLRTTAGWSAMGNGLLNTAILLNPDAGNPLTLMARAEVSNKIKNYVITIPERGPERFGEDLGFGIEKVAEVILISKGSGMLKGGRSIVGTTFDEILPTQDWINPIKVSEYKSILQSGQELSPIQAYRQTGKIFIEDGHHRFVAYMETGIQPKITIRNTAGPIGFPNWLNTTFQIPH